MSRHQPTPLDELLGLAQGYAEFPMRNIGHVPPSLLANSPIGLIHFVPDNLKDARAKDNFANTVSWSFSIPIIIVSYGWLIVARVRI